MPEYVSMKSSELKALMVERGIDFGDCLEKSEFVKQLVAYDQEEKKPAPTPPPSKPASKNSSAGCESKSSSTKKPSKLRASPESKDNKKDGPKTTRVRKNTPAYKLFESEMSATLTETDPVKLAKLIATKWQGLSRADKLHWSDRGKAAVAAEGAVPSASAFLLAAVAKPDPTVKLTAAAVKKVIYLNEDICTMNYETVHLVSKAAELFVGWMAESAGKAVPGKSLTTKDYHSFLKTSEKLRFLRATVETTPQGNPVDDPSVAIFRGPPKAHTTPQPKKKKLEPQVSEDEDAPLSLKKPKLNLQPVSSPASSPVAADS